MQKINNKLFSWASMLEDQARNQAIVTSQLPFIFPHVALMPDAHWGMGSTVGSVIPTVDVVIPAAVGVDIGCGMSASRTSLTVDDLSSLPPLLQLRDTIVRDIPMSAGNYCSRLSETVLSRVALLEDKAYLTRSDPDSLSSNWRLQLGTLGSGNHFIELCRDVDGRLWVFLHSGSRGVGNKIAMKHVKNAQKLCERWHISLPHKDLAYLPEGDSAFSDYLRDLSWAQLFAKLNRDEMVDRVIAALSEWAGSTVISEETISTHHNYTVKERHFGQEVWVTRKGAISAQKGELGLIPGSMGTCSYVVRGLGNPVALCSAPHGAGRAMSRKAARMAYSPEQLASAMEGIEWRSDQASLLVDEIPSAYKDIEQVIVDAGELVSVEHMLSQILNVKGT